MEQRWLSIQWHNEESDVVLSDSEIKKAILDGELFIMHDNEPDVRSASICLHLSEKIIVPSHGLQEIDIRNIKTYPGTIAERIDPSNGYLLSPGGFMLGATLESIALSNSLAGQLSNISGLARLGLNTVLSTYISPGFGMGRARPITLELHNTSNSPIRIFPGMRACHLLLTRLGSATLNGYDHSHPGKYLINSPQGSEFYMDTGLVNPKAPRVK